MRTIVLAACFCLLLTSVGCQPGGVTRSGPAGAGRSEELLQDAEEFLSRDLTDSALAAFGLALEDNPRLTEAHIGMGDIYRERGQYELAEPAYERAIETDPDSFDAHYSLGLVQQLQGRVREAVQTYLRALTIDPDSPKANRDLASAYLQINQAARAVPYAERATRLNPESQAAWANLAAAYSLVNQHENALDAYRQAADLGQLDEPVLLGWADAHLRLDNYDLAINTLQPLLQANPSSTAYERLGLAHFKMREFEQALEYYRTALQIDDRDTAALNGVGVCLMTLYLEDGRRDTSMRDEAVEAWRRSLSIRPSQDRITDLLYRFRNQ